MIQQFFAFDVDCRAARLLVKEGDTLDDGPPHASRS